MELWGQHGDYTSFKYPKRRMKRDVKSLLSVSIATMKLPSSIDAPLALPLDISNDEITCPTFHVLHDSTLVVDGIPTNTFRWLEELS